MKEITLFLLNNCPHCNYFVLKLMCHNSYEDF